jgi:hypothetical protein
MITEAARAGRLGLDELRRILQANESNLQYHYLTRLEENRISRFDPQESYDQWEAGRAFGRDFEIRWQKEKENIKVMILGNIPLSVPDLSDSIDLDEAFYRKEGAYYLWGIRLEDGSGWDETRIPHLIKYPVDGQSGRRLQLQTVEYIRKETGNLEFYRFSGFKEVE